MLVRLRLLSLAVVLVALAGCRTTRPPDLDVALPDAFPNHSLDQVEQRLRLASDTLQAFAGRGNLRFESAALDGSFTATVRARRNDSVYVALSPGLGIEAGRLLVTPDSVYVYNRLKKELSAASVDEAGGLLAMPLEGDELFRNMIGFVVPELDGAWTLAPDSATYTLRSPDGDETYTVDPALWRVVRYERRGPSGDLLEERIFEAFDELEGVYVPRRVVFRRPPDGVLAAFYYRDLDLSPGPLSFDLRVSSDAKRVPLGR